MGKNRMIGFVGAGNMATALVKGLIESRLYKKEQLAVSDRSGEAREKVRDRFHLTVHSSNLDLVREVDVIVLAVKPQVMEKVLADIREGVRDEHLIVSIAAGIPIKSIREGIGRDLPIIRVMPNTPALVQKGMSALAGSPRVSPEQMKTAAEIFQAVGDTVEVDESMMDAVTALSGSGPGYLFRIMEGMISAGAAVGLEKETAYRLVIQTFIGAAHLAKDSGESPSKLRERVTSPGGTTEAGLGVLEASGLETMLRKAVEAAYNRSIELGRKK